VPSGVRIPLPAPNISALVYNPNMSFTQRKLLLRTSLIVQIIAMGLGLLIEYQTRNADDFSGLIAMVPYGAFSILLIINIIYAVILSAKLRKSK
jgi:hypothetical protein